MPDRLLLVSLCPAVTSCGRPPESVFGRSYDECILKNAPHASVGDEAVEACVRHFEREPTTLERNIVSGNGFAAPPLPNTFEDGAMFLEVQNQSSTLLVTEVQVDIPFYNDLPDVQPVTLEHQEWSRPADQILAWTFSTRLRPHDHANFRGRISSDQHVGQYAEHRTPRATRVVDLGPPPPRGRRADGRALVIPKDFVKHGFREAAREAATDRLGQRTRQDERLALSREVRAHRPTRLDALLARQISPDGELRVSRIETPGGDPAMTTALKARARELHRLGLATETRRNVMSFRSDWRSRLTAMELHLDIRKRLVLQRTQQQRQPARGLSLGRLLGGPER